MLQYFAGKQHKLPCPPPSYSFSLLLICVSPSFPSVSHSLTDFVTAAHSPPPPAFSNLVVLYFFWQPIWRWMRALAGLKKRWKLPKKVMQTKLFFFLWQAALLHLMCTTIQLSNEWRLAAWALFRSKDEWCGCDFLLVRQPPPRGARLCLYMYASVCLNRDLLLFGAVSLCLWVNAVCLLSEAIKSAPHQPGPASAGVINSGCLLSLSEDYPEACC